MSKSYNKMKQEIDAFRLNMPPEVAKSKLLLTKKLKGKIKQRKVRNNMNFSLTAIDSIEAVKQHFKSV